MQRIIFLIGIMSLLTLASASAVLIYWTVRAPEDAGFLRDYLLRYSGDERQTARSITTRLAQSGNLTDATLKDYLVDAEIRRRTEDVKESPMWQRIALRVRGMFVWRRSTRGRAVPELEPIHIKRERFANGPSED